MEKVKAVKHSVKSTVNDARVAAKNFERLVEATALIVVASYTIKQALEMERTALFYVLVVAGSIIALRGTVEFFKHLARKD